MINTKIILKVFAVLILIFISTIVSVCMYEMYKLNKFKEMKLTTSLKDLKNDWGEPDKIYNNKEGTKTVFYYSIMNEFVFNIDQSQKVIFKYKDNF